MFSTSHYSANYAVFALRGGNPGDKISMKPFLRFALFWM